MVLFELCAMKPTFKADTMVEQAQKICRRKYEELPEHTSEEMKDLINALLHPNPKLRPSINELLKESLLQNEVNDD